MKCNNCLNDFEKKHHNQKYCHEDCRIENYNEKTKIRTTLNKCVICKFNKIVELHHIIKRYDYGSNDEINLVYLCPNHHRMADSLHYEDMMKNLIFKKTGKVGKKFSQEEIEEIELEIDKRSGRTPRGHHWWHVIKIQMINNGFL